MIIEMDVFKFGFVRCGISLFKSMSIGIAQGSPLSPAIADLVLRCVEDVSLDGFINAERLL